MGSGYGGSRRGSGAPRGPRKTTIERALIATQTVDEARRSGKKLAKEVLEEFMMLFAGIAAQAQPIPVGMTTPPGRAPDPAKFETFARLTVTTAAELAKYQSPTFKAVAVTMSPGDSGRPIPLNVDPKQIKTIEGKVVNLADQVAVARAYTRLVSGSKS